MRLHEAFTELGLRGSVILHDTGHQGILGLMGNRMASLSVWGSFVEIYLMLLGPSVVPCLSNKTLESKALSQIRMYFIIILFFFKFSK